MIFESITELGLSGVYAIRFRRHLDKRGYFVETFRKSQFRVPPLDRHFVGSEFLQCNESFSLAGTIRGLHFQRAPAAEIKIVRCLSGRIFDIVLDLRRDSPTFLQWQGIELSADNGKALLLPQGCAHGFQTLTDEVQLLYMHTAFYEPAVEGGIRFDDPRVGINWPLPATQVSARDQQHPLLPDDFIGIQV